MKLDINLCILYTVFIVRRESSCSSVLKLLGININHSSNGTLLGVFMFESLEVCATSCLRVTHCAFVNYDYPRKICVFWDSHEQFVEVRTETQEMALVDMNDWKQVMKNDPCFNKPCQPGERCVPNRSSYICEEYCPCCNTPYFSRHTTVNASSVDSTSHISDLSLTSNGGWLPKSSDQNPYLLVSFSEAPFLIRGIVTRGDQQRNGWVSRYSVEASVDCQTFTLLGEYSGNEDAENAVITYITPPIIPKCLKIFIETYENVRSMTMDLIGCFV